MSPRSETYFGLYIDWPAGVYERCVSDQLINGGFPIWQSSLYQIDPCFLVYHVSKPMHVFDITYMSCVTLVATLLTSLLIFLLICIITYTLCFSHCRNRIPNFLIQ